jgi:hypothetical protein
VEQEGTEGTEGPEDLIISLPALISLELELEEAEGPEEPDRNAN